MQHFEEDLFNEIQEEDLRGDIREIAETMGVETARGLIRHFGGFGVYIPKVTSIQPVVRRMVQKLKQQGKSKREIARILRVSERFLRRL